LFFQFCSRPEPAILHFGFQIVDDPAKVLHQHFAHGNTLPFVLALEENFVFGMKIEIKEKIGRIRRADIVRSGPEDDSGPRFDDSPRDLIFKRVPIFPRGLEVKLRRGLFRALDLVLEFGSQDQLRGIKEILAFGQLDSFGGVIRARRFFFESGAGATDENGKEKQ